MKHIITLLILITYNVTFSQIDYNTQIQPIFDNNCVSCHSNGAGYTGGIELNSYENLMAGGNTTDASNVLSVLEDYIVTGYMPAWGNEPLTDEEIALITQWIFEGGNPDQAINECILSDGTIVESGWFGPDTGNNWCNTCFCENGILGCTELECEGCEIDLDEDGICDEVDDCIGTWIEEVITGSCYDISDEETCISYGCSWTNEYTGVWLWEDVCGYQGSSTYVISENIYCDELSGGCIFDVDEDGICEDDCEELVTIIEDCDCSFNPNTYLVSYTEVDETSCTLIETCYCECINDINENSICDEDEELTEDCPCINPEWIVLTPVCPFIYQPVMGCNGVMYNNSCEAQAAGVTLWVDELTGETTSLEWDCETTDCIAELDLDCIYMAVWDPVCGCNGITYSNSGEAACNNIFEYTNGECETIQEGCWENGELYTIGSQLFISECEYIECDENQAWSNIISIINCGEPIECENNETLLTLEWTGAGVNETSFSVMGELNGILYETILDMDTGTYSLCFLTDLQNDCFAININGSANFNWNLYSTLSTTPIMSGTNQSMMFGDQCSGCTQDGDFYDIGSELFLNDCQYITCTDEDNWSETMTIDNCEGCIENGEYYCIGCELFISDCEYIVCEGPQNWSDTLIIENCGNNIEGCTDEQACNFMLSANIDNNSCVYDGDPECEDCGTILDFNNYGDNEFFNATYNAPPGVIITINFSGSTESCCDHVYVNGVEYDGELDGVIVGGEELVVEWTTDSSVNSASGYGWSAELICEEPIYGCTQSYAENYDPNANTNDGSCILDCTYLLDIQSYYDTNYDNSISNYYCNYYVTNGTYTIEQAISYGYNCDCVILGCTDPEAINYDDEAFVDDCSCIYDTNCSSISMTGGSYPTEVSWNIVNENGTTVLSGNAPECQNFCFEDGCYTINMLDSYGDGWNNAILSIDEYDYTFTTGSSAIAPFGFNNDNCIIEGCTNSLADNYNEEANYDDGSCEYSCEYLLTYESYIDLGYDYSISNYLCYDYVSNYGYTVEYVEEYFSYNCDCVITGCTDSEATNYDDSAFVDDCSCTYDNDCPAISFNVTDSSLGWEITNIEGEIVLEYNTSGQEIGSYCGNYCFDDGCYFITMTSLFGSGWFGNTLNIGDQSFTLPNGNEGMAAFAYNTDNNCEIGCTDSEASNYNPDAILDDGSCVLFGCTIIGACNYNPEATAFDGSCYYCYNDDCTEYPNDLYDCSGDCYDIDEDGICDALEISGCMDEEACNYNPEATEELFGACEYPEQYYDCDNNCLNDNDDDEICNELDNCPLIYNPNQDDYNNDGIGDACDGVSLNEENNFKWNIYPNPFNDFTTIQFTNINHNQFNIKILNLSGKIIYDVNTFKNEHIIINNFSSGYYILQLETNNAIIRETLIIQ
ncbi:MAG: hypothetical protein CMP49_02515 [Flavobacteriales bacterium]|nr:hypothetical protein [Flavobacteriales bacterium]|tara:strand:+ start:4550 stop:8758 length:4209 start_codon:yes stop_codon:yes gene_type:complete